MSTLKSVTIVHPSSAVNNIVNDASGNVAVGNNLTVAGSSTITGNETVTGTLTVGGAAVVAVAPTTAGNVPFSTNGTTWSSTAKIVQGTAVASTSGTSIDFTGIPSWVKRVTVMFNGVSTSGTSPKLIQLGSGSVTSTGYISAGGIISGSTGFNVASSTAGFIINSIEGADNIYGSAILNLVTGNTWGACGTLGDVTGTYVNAYTVSGGVTLSGALDRVRITTVNGTDTFDAGTINIMYE